MRAATSVLRCALEQGFAAAVAFDALFSAARSFGAAVPEI
jgi:hypothetical protein